MRTIRISDEVWNEIAKKGKFGENEDDVLRRVFEIPPKEVGQKKRPRYSTDRLSLTIKNGYLHLRFSSGKAQKFALPDPDDREAVKLVTYNAMGFAKNWGATDGQINAVRKKLTDAGYYIAK